MSNVSELDGLIGQAAGVDGEVAATEPGAVMEAQALAEVSSLSDDNAQCVAMILALSVPILGKLYPSLIAIYTEEAQGQVSASLGPVLAKYGVNLKEGAGRYKEEIAAAFVCGPIAWASYHGIKADAAARAGTTAKTPVLADEVKPPAVRVPVPGDFEYREPM